LEWVYLHCKCKWTQFKDSNKARQDIRVVNIFKGYNWFVGASEANWRVGRRYCLWLEIPNQDWSGWQNNKHWWGNYLYGCISFEMNNEGKTND